MRRLVIRSRKEQVSQFYLPQVIEERPLSHWVVPQAQISLAQLYVLTVDQGRRRHAAPWTWVVTDAVLLSILRHETRLSPPLCATHALSVDGGPGGTWLEMNFSLNSPGKPDWSVTLLNILILATQSKCIRTVRPRGKFLLSVV